MTFPAAWNTVPITGSYAEIFGKMPTNAVVMYSTDEIVTCAGVTVFGAELRVLLDANGNLSTNLPATDDPDLDQRGWMYKVTELWDGGRTFYMSVPIAAAGTGIDMADVAPVADPTTGELYVKGDTGPAAYTLKGAVATYADLPTGAAERDAYEVLADGDLYIFTNGAWPADGSGVPFRGETGPSGEANLSDTTPLALGVAAAGTSVDASRADHVHPMPSATDVGADPAGTAATAVAAITPTGIGAIATSEKGVANGVATLDAGGLLPTAQLPPLAISDTFVVNTQAAMLALTAQPGDVCVRTDSNTTYILATSPASTLANWVAFLAPGQVVSVNSKTGVVSLTAADVGLGNVDNTSDADKPVSAAQATALGLKFDKVGGTITPPTNTPAITVVTDFNGGSWYQNNVSADGSLYERAKWDGRYLRRYYAPNVSVINNIQNGGWRVEGTGAVIINGPSFEATPTADNSPAIRVATSLGYATPSRTLTNNTLLFSHSWAWDGSAGYNIGSTFVISHRQRSAANNDSIVEFRRGVGAPVIASFDPYTGSLTLAGTITPGSFTVETLPLSPGEGAIAYATNGRKVGEAAGSGTGVLVYYSAGKWRVFSTDAQVQS